MTNFRKDYERDSCGANDYEEYLENRLLIALTKIGMLRHLTTDMQHEIICQLTCHNHEHIHDGAITCDCVEREEKMLVRWNEAIDDTRWI